VGIRTLASFFPKEKLAEIRSRANIVDIISEYVTFKKSGKNYLALCPFHAEKTPSFHVNEEKQIFYCFGCQKGGDVITFLREINNLSFVEAVSQLAHRYGLPLPPPSSYRKEKATDQDKFLEINEKAMDFFHHVLMQRPEGEVGRKYLKKRGIDQNIWETFKLGYALDTWDSLSTFLTKSKIPLQLARQLGLIAPRERGGFFDSFRGRIIFPIFNLNGMTIGFGGRAIGEGNPKYLNSSDSMIYKKSLSLFGLPITRNSIVKENQVLIVEGYFDLLSLFQAKICSVVSPLGTALTGGHIQTLKRFTSRFYVVFDADEAGDKAALRSLEMFLSEGISPRVVILPSGSDPDEFIQQKGAESFRKKIETAPLLIEYFIERAIEKKNVSLPEGKVEVIKEVMPIIDHIREPIIQDEYIRKLSEKLGVREDRIRRLGRLSLSYHAKELSSPVDETRREEFLLTLMLQKPELIPDVDAVEVVEDLDSHLLQEIAKTVISLYNKEGEVAITTLIDQLGEEKGKLATRLSLKEENFTNITGSLKDCILQIKKNKFKKMQAQLTAKIKKAQDVGDETKIRDLNEQKLTLILQEKNLPTTIGTLLNL
jgi:DNA primase